MQTFLLSGAYTREALKEISVERTQQAVTLIKKLGGTVQAMYVVLGDSDLMLIVALPNISEAIKASVELNKMTGIAFKTSPLIAVEEFDKLMTE